MNSTAVTAKPNVYDFVEPVSFIKEWFQYSKQIRPEFTLRSWARELGFKNVSILVEILKKKRPFRFKFIENFESGFCFDASEKLYFETIVKLAESESDSERSYFEKLCHRLRPQNTEPVYYQERAELFSHWLDTALVELCKIKKVTKQEKSVLNLFHRQIDQAEFSQTVEKLVAANLLEEDSSGVLKVVKKRVSTQSDRSNRAVHGYYKEVNSLASDACELPVESREFQCFSMAIREDQVPQLKEAIRTARASLENFADSKSGEVVFQVNLQTFPLTQIG